MTSCILIGAIKIQQKKPDRFIPAGLFIIYTVLVLVTGQSKYDDNYDRL